MKLKQLLLMVSIVGFNSLYFVGESFGATGESRRECLDRCETENENRLAECKSDKDEAIEDCENMIGYPGVDPCNVGQCAVPIWETYYQCTTNSKDTFQACKDACPARAANVNAPSSSVIAHD